MRGKPFLIYTLLVVVLVFAIRTCTAGYGLPPGAIAFSPAIDLSVPGEPELVEAIEWYRSCNRGEVFRPGLYHMRLHLEPPLGGLAPDIWYVLVFPSINGAAIRVALDGTYLGSQGDYVRGRSIIWNSAKAFQIPPGLIRQDSTVQVEILGVYEAGIIKQPYMMEHAAARNRLAYLGFISEQAVWLLCGAILVMGIAILAIGYSSLPKLDGRVVLGLAAVCTAFFLADFLTFEYLPVSLLSFKKMVVVLRHLAAILFVFGFLRLLGRRLDWFAKGFSLVQFFCILAALVPSTMVELKNLYTYTYLTILPFQFYLLYLLYHTRHEGPGRRLLLVGVSVGVVAAMHDILITLIVPNSILISHFGFMILTLSLTAFVVSDIMQNYRQLVVEQNRAETYREASLHDPLTGVFNRGILPLVRESLRGPFAILTADLDGFKAINDRYGHVVGDRVLMDLVSVMTRVFRRGDYLVRTGGDEFMAILPASPVEAFDGLKAKLEEALSKSRISVHDVTDQTDGNSATGGDPMVSYSVSIGHAHYSDNDPPDSGRFEALMAEADRRLYEMKRNPGR